MLDLSGVAWLVVCLSAFMIGFSKTGIPGAGILVAPLMATVMLARNSTGFVLPMLAMADVMAILYWRRHVDWRRLIRILPWTFVGVILGYIVLKYISNRKLMPVIGIIVLVLLGITWWRGRQKEQKIPTNWWFAGLMGVLAGGTSMMANAAGPIMVIYLLAMKLKKEEFIGTTAWFFWILNLTKMPFSFHLDLINRASLMTNLAVLPLILMGGVAGILLVHRIPQKPFDLTVKILAMAAAVFLCIKPLLM